MRFLQNIRGYLQRPLVRPWALAGPVLIILLALPFLQPLSRPDPTQWSDEEQMIAATVQAIVEQHSLAIDQSVFADNPVAVRRGDHLYSPFSPLLPAMLAPAYWVMLRQGMGYQDDLIFVQYLLTLLGAAIPVAMCTGMVYRLARSFELRRSLRVGLGVCSVAAGGLLSYAVVLNRHAPAAMLLLGAFSCISHLGVANHPYRHILMAGLAGLLAATAASIDPAAMILAALLCLPLIAMRWNPALRAGAVVLYLCGAAVPVALTLMWLQPMQGHLPGAAQPGKVVVSPSLNLPVAVQADFGDLGDDEYEGAPSAVQVGWSYVSTLIGRILEALVGDHGLVSHAPALVLGLLGAIWVLHRNWTPLTKSLSAVTLLAGMLLILTLALINPTQPMSYGIPWFVCLSPVLMLWAGAWLKHAHRTQSWIMAGVVCLFSIAVSVVGMSNPTPRGGYRAYSFGEAGMALIRAERPVEVKESPRQR